MTRILSRVAGLLDRIHPWHFYSAWSVVCLWAVALGFARKEWWLFAINLVAAGIMGCAAYVSRRLPNLAALTCLDKALRAVVPRLKSAQDAVDLPRYQAESVILEVVTRAYVEGRPIPAPMNADELYAALAKSKAEREAAERPVNPEAN